MVYALLNDVFQRCLTFNKMDQKANLKKFIAGLDLPSHAKVLDFGCGTGLFQSLFDKMGYIYCGYDIDARLIDYAGYLYPRSFFTASKDKLSEMGPFDLVVINCCCHHIPDGDMEMALVELKTLLSPKGVCLLVDILKVDSQNDTFFHKQFMKMEQGQFVRYRDAYLRLLEKHFILRKESTWRSYLFSLPARFNPIYNDLLSVACCIS